MSQESLLEVKNLTVAFNDNVVLKDINFSVHRGDVLAILGPNGSGKSVLLRSILDLIPFKGSVKWHGKPKIGYIPQHMNVDRDFPLSVREFMEMKSSSIDKIIDSLKAVGMESEHHIEDHILNQRLGWLSGGQLQRVMIAWSIIDDPDVLLYDEPTSGIDIGGEETIYMLLDKLQRERKMAILLISHDLNIVYKYAEKVLCLNKKMICFGIPTEVLDPASLAELYGGETRFYHHKHP